MNTMEKSATLLVIAMITALPAAADVKVVATQAAGTPVAISSKFGKVVDAVNIAGNSLTCDGIKFVGQVVPGGTASQIIETTPLTVTLSTKAGNLASAPIGADALFQTEAYSDGFRDISLLIAGLDPKKTYQIQYLHGDTRPDAWARYSNGTQTFTDSTGKKATKALSFNTAPNTDQFAVVTVEVSGSTSLLCELPHSSADDGRGPSFAGYVVLEKP